MAEYKLLTVDDVADMLTIARRSVLALIRDGELEAVKINARSYRVTPEALESFVDSRRTSVERDDA